MDQWIWCPTSSGSFSTSSARKLLHPSGQSTQFLKRIWHYAIPKNLSIFVWRIFAACIPTDDNVQKSGIHICSACYCCRNRKEETDDHLFLHGELATEVWSRFCDLLEAWPSPDIDFSFLLQNLLSLHSFSNQYGAVVIFTAVFIPWEIWERLRNMRIPSTMLLPSSTRFSKMLTWQWNSSI